MATAGVEATRFYQPERLTSTEALRPYQRAPRLMEWVADKRLERFRKKNTNPDGSAKFHYTAIVTRAQPWQLGHEKSFDAADSITDPTGKVVIVIPDVGERNLDNPFTAEKCEEIITERLTARGIPEDRYTFFHIIDLHNPPLWVETIVTRLENEQGITLDAVVSLNPGVIGPFEGLSAQLEHPIAVLQPPSVFRRRNRGGVVREGLRASGDLVPV